MRSNAILGAMPREWRHDVAFEVRTCSDARHIIDHVLVPSQQTGPTTMALLSTVPWRTSARPRCEDRAPVDYLLQPLFVLAYLYMSLTLVRIFCAALLVPPYLLLAFYRSVWPFLLQTGTSLLTPKGRSKLEHDGRHASARRESRAQQQLREDYRFEGKDFEGGFHRPRAQTRPMPGFAVDNECLEVCGLRVNVVHKRPAGSVKGTLVLLHGNPSSSFMYRHVSRFHSSPGTQDHPLVETQMRD